MVLEIAHTGGKVIHVPIWSFLCHGFLQILVSDDLQSLDFSVVPLLRDSVGVLMQRQPRSLDDTLPGCYQRVGFK